MEKIGKFILALCFVGVGILVSTNAFAELVNYGYQSELNTQYGGSQGNNEFFIHNPSGPNTYITKIELTWGDNVMINSITGATVGAKFTIHGSGTQWTSVSAAALGLSSSYAISVDRKTATFTFTDFGPGETAAINMILREINPGKGKGAGVGGEDMTNAFIKIYYAGQGGTTPILSSGYLIQNANDKKIYVETEGTYDNGLTKTPIPATLYLLGAGIAGLAGLKRRFKK